MDPSIEWWYVKILTFFFPWVPVCRYMHTRRAKVKVNIWYFFLLLSILFIFSQQLWSSQPHQTFCGCWDLNPNPHAFRVNIWPTESYLHTVIFRRDQRTRMDTHTHTGLLSFIGWSPVLPQTLNQSTRSQSSWCWSRTLTSNKPLCLMSPQPVLVRDAVPLANKLPESGAVYHFPWYIEGIFSTQ